MVPQTPDNLFARVLYLPGKVSQELGVGLGLAHALQDALDGVSEIDRIIGNHGYHAPQ